MDRTTVEKNLQKMQCVRALVIGDLMLDEYLWGQTERISPEAPVQIVDVRREDMRLGGAGNVINNALALGAKVDVVSVLGDDRDGEALRTILEKQGLATDKISFVHDRKTARKTRVLASNQQMIRIDRESRDPIDSDLEQHLTECLHMLMPVIDVVLISDYQKGLLTETFLQSIIRLAKQQAVPLLADPKGDTYSKYRGANLLTPNRKEASLATGIDIVDENSLLRAGRQLRHDLELDALAITRSEEGMTLFLGDREVHIPTRAREVFDVTGAGDTVMTVLGVALVAGVPLDQAAELANLAAGIVVGKVGTSTVTPDEILAEVTRQHQDTDQKIKKVDALKTLLDKERDRGRKIVFTNGCFDLLHVGHVKYLQQAKQLGEVFVLGLNSDDSIRRLKGHRRPLISQEERAHLLAALSCIDYVVVFDEDTPLDLISAVRPDILVKGGDYTLDGVVGRDLVEGYGGRVELIRFVEGKSTTKLINQILESYQE